MIFRIIDPSVMEKKMKWVTSAPVKDFLRKFSMMNPAVFNSSGVENKQREYYEKLARQFIYDLADHDNSEHGDIFFKVLQDYMKLNIVREIALPPLVRAELYNNRLNHELRKNGAIINDPRPLAIVIKDKNDYNGAHLDDGIEFKISQDVISEREIPSLIRQGYRVMVTDSQDFEEAIQSILDFTRFEPAKLLIFRSHGSKNTLGGWINITPSIFSYFYNTTSAKDKEYQRELKGRVEEVLVGSCSTGRESSNIVDKVSQIIGARSVGPREDISFMIFDKGGNDANRFRFYMYHKDKKSYEPVQSYVADPFKNSRVTQAMKVTRPLRREEGRRQKVQLVSQEPSDQKRNTAMVTDPTGGIDFNSINKDVQIKNKDGNITLQIDPAMFARLQKAPGFVPVIINIQLLKNLQQFLNADTATAGIISKGIT